MPRWNILITAPRACEALETYRRGLEPVGCRLLVHPPRERHDEAGLLPLVPDVDGMICGDDRVTARVIDAAPRLRVIAKWGTGIDSIDCQAARRRGVAVRNVPGAFSDPVADTVLGYVLLFARRLDAMDADVRAGRWVHLPLVSLREATLGVVGFGSTGRAVARRAVAFGMTTLACDIRPIEAEAATLGVRTVSLDELLAGSDFITLHADLRPESRQMIDARRLAMMRPSAVLINTARGALVDEEALTDALRGGRLAGAALDVFAEEPLPRTSPLRGLPNVRLAPHNANSSSLAASRVHEIAMRNVMQVLRGEAS